MPCSSCEAVGARNAGICSERLRNKSEAFPKASSDSGASERAMSAGGARLTSTGSPGARERRSSASTAALEAWAFCAQRSASKSVSHLRGSTGADGVADVERRPQRLAAGHRRLHMGAGAAGAPRPAALPRLRATKPRFGCCQALRLFAALTLPQEFSNAGDDGGDDMAWDAALADALLSGPAADTEASGRPSSAGSRCRIRGCSTALTAGTTSPPRRLPRPSGSPRACGPWAAPAGDARSVRVTGTPASATVPRSVDHEREARPSS